jgi:hypothetical protein
MILYPERQAPEPHPGGRRRPQDPAGAIAVREPNVHWDGKRAVFSMVSRRRRRRTITTPVYWQIYEVTGLGEGEAAKIERVPNQPETFNNVSPVYGSDGRIVFTTDRPITGQMRHYPQLDEYESVETNTGVWSFDPAVNGGDLRLLTHVPSGAFSPKVALDGRVVYIRWDHLQRDQQADVGTRAVRRVRLRVGGQRRQVAAGITEDFPEERNDDLVKPGNHRHQFNQFFPWQIHQDGTVEETSEPRRPPRDGRLHRGFAGRAAVRSASTSDPITNFFHIMEDPANPGIFYGVDAPEFGTHTTGAIVKINGALGVNADDMRPMHVTDPATAGAPEAGSPVGESDGRYRNPVPLSDGSLIAVVNVDPRQESGNGTGPFGNETYKLRLRHLVPKEGSGYFVYEAPLTEGIVDEVTYFSNQQFEDVTYTGEMWELDPVEVVARPEPPAITFEVPKIEQAVIDQLMVASGGMDALRKYLADNGYALLISRNVTRRADDQQPYNLAVPGGASTVAEGETPEEVDFIQFYQADQVRGYTEHRDGRRPVPRPMHSAPDGGEGPEGAYRLGMDGSFAALVPARRALSWQLTARGRDAGRARALLGHLPARRDPRVPELPRSQQDGRRARGGRTPEYTRDAGASAAVSLPVN